MAKCLEFSCPGKTFFIGEYSVLSGSGTLLACTSPRFYFKFSDHFFNGAKKITSCFHSASPASKFLNEMAHKNTLLNSWAYFYDPYESKGGFGSSTAQFLFVWAIKNFGLYDDWYSIWRTYLSLTPEASGADLVAQFNGMTIGFWPYEEKCEQREWPFDDLTFSIWHTGVKINTHEHLATIQNRNFLSLGDIAQCGLEAWKTKKARDFVYAIKEFSLGLAMENLVWPKTKDILEHLKKCPGVLTAKGCGALGADTILVLCLRGEDVFCKSFLCDQGFKMIASEENISRGLLKQQSLPTEGIEIDEITKNAKL